MLAFIDESGHPHANDPSTRPVVVAVCIEDDKSRAVSARLHGLKRDYLMQERRELKGSSLINRRTFRRKPQYVQFLEAFFEMILNAPITVFAIVMQAPFQPAQRQDDWLPRRFRFLAERIELLAGQSDTMATVMMDGSAGLYGGIGWQFNGFLYRSPEGQSYTHVTDVPAFVDSVTSAGIQIADMVASVIRQYEEAGLYMAPPEAGDTYRFTIRRWYNIIQGKTLDQQSADGHQRLGIYRLGVGES